MLRPTKPLASGQKVKCPKCGGGFTYQEPAAAQESKPAEPAKPNAKRAPVARRDVQTSVLPTADDIDLAAEKKPSAGKRPSRQAGPGKAEVKTTELPVAEKVVDESDDLLTYTFRDEGVQAENEETKISYVPDTSIRDLRGPAIAKLVGPSNALIYAGMMSALLCVATFGYNVWPWLFPPENGYILDVEDTLKVKMPGDNSIPKNPKELRDNYKDVMDEAEYEEKKERVIYAIIAVVQFFWNLVMAVGAVKMQNLESYNWGMAAAIMGINPLTLTGPGVWALVTLLKEEVKAGFEYKGIE